MAIGKDDSLCIRFRGSQESIASVLTRSEMCMLEALEKVDRFPQTYTEQEARAAGRRTRQPVITHLLDLHLLDDTYAGITRTLLSQCNSWSFNTFNLDVATGGRSLSYLLVHLFQEYGFVQHFHLDIVKVWHCFNLMESAYHRHNPYHNSVHAADVTQAMHCFLQENKFAAYLTPLEAMSSVIAAVAHDLDHPGVTQAFLVATSNHLVNLYHNSSVLENHHWRTAISCLSESGIFNHLDKDVWFDIQKQIRSLILATDITRQKEFLAKFKNYLNSDCLDMEKTQYRHFALQIALKCADLCNPCRPWAISQRWSYQVCQEFYRQGAYERQLKLPLTPTFDCSRTKVAKIQADFFEFVVSPLFETWDHFLKTPLSSKLLENLHHNYSQWQTRMLIMQETESESNVEPLDAPQITIDTCSDSLENVSVSEDIDNSNQLSLGQDIIVRQHRSKSDSGLTPRLPLPPKVHMETYSTEELHPSTTLLSLSSITNTVQLRKVYAATKVESHLICPTVFQPILSSSKPKESDDTDNNTSVPEYCSEELHPVSSTETEVNSDNNAQSSVILTCTDGCGTPSPPKMPAIIGVNHAKQRSQSLINDSEVMKYYSQVLQCRRASDIGPNSYNKFSTAQKCAPVISNNSSFSQIQHNEQLPSLCDESTIQSFSRSYASDVSDSNKYINVCPNNVCPETCICETTESYNKTPSWCWHISRSFSEERPIRPSQDFDSPLPSWQGSASSLAFNGRSGRRSSAPVAVSNFIDISGSHLSSVGEVDSKSPKGECEGTTASGRRWSVPSETISGVQFARITSNLNKREFVPVHTTRRSSCGIIDNVMAASTGESEDINENISSLSKPNDFSYTECEEHNLNEDDEYEINRFANSDSALPFYSSFHQSRVQRRSSLPSDIPIALMRRVSSPTRVQRKVSGEHFLFSRDKRKSSNQSSFLLDNAHKHESPSDLLSVLIGPSGMLNSMHGIVSGQTICEMPCMAQETSRRRSGGLDMLSGNWKSRTSDVIIGVSMASKLRLRSQLLQEWASWRTEKGNVKPTESANLSISVLGQQKLYQPRRGSVPLNISLLSLSSGMTVSLCHNVAARKMFSLF